MDELTSTHRSERHVEYSQKHHFNTDLIDGLMDDAAILNQQFGESIDLLNQKYQYISDKLLTAAPKPGFLNTFSCEKKQRDSAITSILPTQFKTCNLTTNFIPSWFKLNESAFSPFFSGFVNRESYLIMKDYESTPVDHNADYIEKNHYHKRYNNTDDLYATFRRDFKENVFSIMAQSSSCNLILGLRRENEDQHYKRHVVLSGALNSFVLESDCKYIDLIAYPYSNSGFNFSIKKAFVSEFSSPTFNIEFTAKKTALYNFFVGVTPQNRFSLSFRNTSGSYNSVDSTLSVELLEGDTCLFSIPANSILHYFGYNLY